MVDFDPAKEAINLSKYGVSLSRWIDLDIKVTTATTTERSAIVLTASLTAPHIVWFSPTEMARYDRSAFDALTQRR
jgi:hypothetical protein